MKKLILIMLSIVLALSSTMFVSADSLSTNNEGQETKDFIENLDFDMLNNIEGLNEDIRSQILKLKEFTDNNDNYTFKDLNEILDLNKQSIKDKIILSSNTDNNSYNNWPVEYGYLNEQECAVYEKNEAYGLIVMAQAQQALDSEASRYGSNTAGTNGDAFRHTLWNALGAKYTSVSYMKEFANAHETGASNYDCYEIETMMDFKNNQIGRDIISTINFPSNPANGMTYVYIITTSVANAVKNGETVRCKVNGIKYYELVPTDSDTTN